MFRSYYHHLPGLLKMLGVAALYTLVAKSCLDYFAANGVISIIWPSSGIALAALLMGGRRYAVAVFVGAFLVSASKNIPLWTAAGIALGNTLEAVVGAWLLRRNLGHAFTLHSSRDYLRLILLGGGLGSTIAALVGVTLLLLSGFLPFETYFNNLTHWWMGDALGIILITPVILVWQQPQIGSLKVNQLVEAMLIIGTTFLAGQIVFLDWFHNIFGPIPRGYWMFLCIAWTAIRLKPRGVLIVLSMIAFQALWSAYHGIGYFADDIANSELTNYWLYMVTLSLVGMTLATHFVDLEQAQNALREKEFLLTESQRIAHIGSWDIDLDCNKLVWTEETYRIYGVTPATFSPGIESFFRLIHRDDHGIVQSWIEACLAGKQPGEHQFRTVHPGGAVRILSGCGDLIYDDQNRPARMVGTVQDITEQRAVEAKIQRLSRLYAALSQCNQSIVRCTTEAELFQEICRDAVLFGGMKMAWIGLVDSETRMVRVVAHFGDNNRYLPKLQISVSADSQFGRSPTGTAIRENQPFWCQDFLNDPATEPWREEAKRSGWRSMAALPIRRNEIPIGNFSLYSDEQDAFDTDVCKLLIEMATDISFALDNFDREAERQKAEKALRKNEQYLRTIIETEPECVKIVGGNGELMDMNRAGLAMLEAESVSEIRQYPLLDFIVPEYRDAFIALHQRVMNGEKGMLEFEIIGLRGARRWLETHAAPLPDETGKITVLLGVTRDITSRKQVEQALQESETRLMLAIKGSSDAPWDWNLEKNQMYYSPQWWHMLGYETDEVAGDADLWQSLVHPDDIAIIQHDLRIALESGQDTHAVEFRLRHKDGHYVPILERSFITRDKTGKVLRISGTNMDLTERHRTQELEEQRIFLLELLTGALPLKDIMDGIVRKLEVLLPESRCSILLVDKEGKMNLGAAPSLPDFYNDAIEGLSVGVGVGSCGNAIATCQRTIVADIASHPYWSHYKELAGKAGLAACWSEPMISSGNKILGSFAIYHRRCATPSTHEIKLIEMAAHFTALAIERKRAEADLKLAAKVFEQSHEGFMITDAKRKIILVNQAFTAITGYTEEEALGQFSNLLASGHHEESFYQNIWAAIQAQGYWQGEIWNRRKNGDVYPELLNVSVVRDAAGKISEYVGVFADITQIKTSERRLEFLAHHDPLTSLPNRLLLFLRIEHGIDVARRENKQMALLMLDLDRFKDVNDSLGHLAGDQLLQLVAERLTSRLRDTDTVARLGGDEFTILLEDIAHPEDAARLAETIIADLSEPWQLPQGGEVQIGVSIGISLYPQYGDTPETLLQQADTALYQAKGAGRNRFAYFSDELTQAVRERIALETKLRRAIAQNELRVFYQPQIDIAAGKIVGAEALVRWQDPVKGLITPDRFIPVAEQTGLIKAIGEWVLRETCRQGRQWMDADLPFLTLAVNVSPHQLKQGNINSVVADVLKETGFPAERLELELTESGLMERDEEAVELLNSLRAQGIRLAIDDFGTGYSSLAYLKRFPLDVLKIDKSFIREIPHHQDDMEIAATIVAMGHTLGFKVLAEGVETKEQLAFLQAQGCDLYQGYFGSRPLPAAEFAAFLQRFG